MDEDATFILIIDAATGEARYCEHGRSRIEMRKRRVTSKDGGCSASVSRRPHSEAETEERRAATRTLAHEGAESDDDEDTDVWGNKDDRAAADSDDEGGGASAASAAAPAAAPPAGESDDSDEDMPASFDDGAAMIAGVPEDGGLF